LLLVNPPRVTPFHLAIQANNEKLCSIFIKLKDILIAPQFIDPSHQKFYEKIKFRYLTIPLQRALINLDDTYLVHSPFNPAIFPRELTATILDLHVQASKTFSY